MTVPLTGNAALPYLVSFATLQHGQTHTCNTLNFATHIVSLSVHTSAKCQVIVVSQSFPCCLGCHRLGTHVLADNIVSQACAFSG